MILATCVEGGEDTVEVILDTVTVIAAFTAADIIQFALVFANWSITRLFTSLFSYIAY